MSATPVFPITGIRGNVVFGEGVHDDAWAVYRLSAATLPDDPLAALASLVPAAGRELSLLRVPRPWRLERCELGMEAAADVRHARRAGLAAYLDTQRRQLTERDPHGVELYLSLRLPPGTTPQAVPAEEEALVEQLCVCPGCERADEADLRRLVVRALYRGLNDRLRLALDFDVDALILGESGPPTCGDAMSAPAARRLTISARPGAVRIATERGHSHQAFLCIGGTPGAAGRGASLLAALDLLPFEVDVALAMRRGGNRSAFNVAVSLCVAARTPDEVEKRVEDVRDALRGTKLVRPAADQLRLFISHLPGQASRLPACELSLSEDELGSLVGPPPTRVGTEAGPYLGYTLDGMRQPVLFDASAAAPAVVLSGPAKSGKTVGAELMMYQAFLAGSRVVDVDPGGEHALCALPEVAIDARVLHLGESESDRGALDPLVLAPGEVGERLARALLLALLPEPCPPDLYDAVTFAVRSATDRGGGCADALELLAAGDLAADAATALAGEASGPIRATPGGAGMPVAALAFGPIDRDQRPTPAAESVTSVRLHVRPDTSHGRARDLLARLLSLYGLRLATHEPRRGSVLGLDGVRWTSRDGATAALARHIARVAAAHRVTALFTTSSACHLEALTGSAGARLCFGVASEPEADRVLRLLGQSSGLEATTRRLMSLPRGACLLQDHAGRVAPVRVDVADPELLAALTRGNPGGRSGTVAQ